MWKLMVILCIAFSTHLSAEIKMLAFSGSNREGSFNKKLVTEAANIAKQMGINVTTINFKDYTIPFYDADLETKEGMPEKVKNLRQLMIQNDVILIASPEYNGSVTALLKNAIDWISRSEEGKPSREAFKGKKFILMSVSPGPGGGVRGLTHLRTIIENIGGTVVSEQLVIPNAYSVFDEQGGLKDPKLKEELQQFIKTTIQQLPL